MGQILFLTAEVMSGLLSRGLARVAALPAASSLRSAPASALVPVQARMVSGPASPFGKAYFKLRGYNQYGLLHDDILAPSANVEKAVTRMPDEMQDLRNYRITRALQCSV